MEAMVWAMVHIADAVHWSMARMNVDNDALQIVAHHIAERMMSAETSIVAMRLETMDSSGI